MMYLCVYLTCFKVSTCCISFSDKQNIGIPHAWWLILASLFYTCFSLWWLLFSIFGMVMSAQNWHQSISWTSISALLMSLFVWFFDNKFWSFFAQTIPTLIKMIKFDVWYVSAQRTQCFLVAWVHLWDFTSCLQRVSSVNILLQWAGNSHIIFSLLG